MILGPAPAHRDGEDRGHETIEGLSLLEALQLALQ